MPVTVAAHRRHPEFLLLIGLGIATGAIDVRIVQVWAWPAAVVGLWFAATALLIAVAAVRLQALSAVCAVAAASLYAVPIAGAILRWHLHPGKTALIGDGALQMQLAGDFLLKRVDPYGADYARAGLGAAPWAEPFPSPALHHLVTWPGQYLWSLPLQAVGRLAGWWDERMYLLIAAAVIWWLLITLFPGTAGWVAASAFFLIPGHSLVAVLGDNDLPMLALVLAALLAADRRRFLLMGLLMGLAVVTKQHGALAVPLILAWAAVRGIDLGTLLKAAVTGGLAALAVLTPFVVWNAGAFVRDTIVFLAGSGVDAYPINGYGLSAFLLSSGVIHGPRDAFPFFVLEIAVAAGLWTIGWRWIHARRRLADVVMFIGITMLAVLYVSRYFHDSHLLLGSELILTGVVAALGAHARATGAEQRASRAA